MLSADRTEEEEYEELLRYAVVTPNIDSGASQPPHSKGEVVPETRIPPIMDDILQNQGCVYFSRVITRSNSSHIDAHEIVVSDFLISDENLQKMENVLDLWSSGLKTNIISELSKWRLNFVDWHRMEMKKEKEKHAADLKQLCNQINSLKELQKTYEVSIGRKDEVISSLSQALGKQKERTELMRTFCHWRIGLVKSRQDVYESKLADQYFQRTLLKKVWRGWRSIVQKQWKEVVERACQARAEEICVQISNDYEAKLAVLSGALENAKAEIQRMQHEKEHFEDSMKKAFMRGVCALNLEAMTIFQNRGDSG
ncbi:Centrosomal protein POC5 [Camelus dromedarius]|uniref:Centrosomal protein POC5 n=1 Tax=Camelus dromedarius TaxID=9838 RepID=A0A5N4EED9_CAMDR|nr:Centrosomal protein POC5 [Camelus dromedarius]